MGSGEKIEVREYVRIPAYKLDILRVLTPALVGHIGA
jgi:hypothetical protein